MGGAIVMIGLPLTAGRHAALMVRRVLLVLADEATRLVLRVDGSGSTALARDAGALDGHRPGGEAVGDRLRHETDDPRLGGGGDRTRFTDLSAGEMAARCIGGDAGGRAPMGCAAGALTGCLTVEAAGCGGAAAASARRTRPGASG
ncbi:MAG: hypothetical protein H6706_19855 [Myxococcales bacterium]|nr:hypothetical protein [Myxococcales bacterium]